MFAPVFHQLVGVVIGIIKARVTQLGQILPIDEHEWAPTYSVLAAQEHESVFTRVTCIGVSIEAEAFLRGDLVDRVYQGLLI